MVKQSPILGGFLLRPCPGHDITKAMKKYDVIIIGAGAAGLAAAAMTTARGRRTAILDMGPHPARKVRVSGGGRCNITNMAAGRDRYFGNNPDFVRGAIARVTPTDILEWARRHQLHPAETDPGRYFCDAGAAAVVDALIHDAAGADIYYDTPVTSVTSTDSGFIVQTTHGPYGAARLIVATGGVSYPNLGVSDIGYRVAKQFGHRVCPPRPGLVAMNTKMFSSQLAGISMPVDIRIGRAVVSDAILMTHNGIGGPAAYRASLYDLTDGIQIDFCPGIDIAEFIRSARLQNGRRTLAGILGTQIPVKMAKWLAGDTGPKNIADMTRDDIAAVATRVNRFAIPHDAISRAPLTGAEVTFGGVDTRDISSKTMESKLTPGLFFVGEVLDVTGDLGGFNLHWAWASGRIAGQSV